MATLNVSEIMTTKLRTMRVDDAVTVADWVMHLDEIHHILVVDDAGKLAGILSDRDILRFYDRTDRIPVGTIMSKPVRSVTTSTAASQAIAQMLDSKVNALAVVDDENRPVGIVTSTDFLDVARWALSAVDARAPHAKADRSEPTT